MSNSKNSWIVSNPDIKNGKLCIRDTGVTVELVIIIQSVILMTLTLAHYLIH